MNANEPARDLHARAQRALAERHAGMLDEQDQAWLKEHLDACDECRQVAADIEDRSELAGHGGHLPTRLVSRWDTESPKLTGVVREHMLGHLRACEQCRKELRMVGHALPSEIAEPDRVRPREASLWTKLRDSLTRHWALSGSLAAAAAALIVVIRLWFIPTPPSPPSSGGAPIAQRPNPSPGRGTPPVSGAEPRANSGAAGPAPAVPRPASSIPMLALAGGGGDVDLSTLSDITLDQSTVRGVGTPGTARAFTVKPGERAIRLDHPEAVLLVEGDQDPVTITITTPSGAAVQFTGRIGQLSRKRPLILTIPGGIEPGTYTYVYAFGGSSREPPIRGSISIRFP